MIKPQQLRKKKPSVLIVIFFAALLMALLLTVYILFSHYYNGIHTEDASTDAVNLCELAEIFRVDLDADVSGYTDADVHSARSAVVNEKISHLPKIDYKPIVDVLKADAELDLSAYSNELDEEDFKIIRWAVYYGFGYILADIEAEISEDAKLPSDTDKGGHSSTSFTPSVTSSYADTEKPSIPIAVTGTEPPSLIGVTVKDEDIYNVLIICVDGEDGSFYGRADTVIIASINKASKRIIFTSFRKYG